MGFQSLNLGVGMLPLSIGTSTSHCSPSVFLLLTIFFLVSTFNTNKNHWEAAASKTDKEATTKNLSCARLFTMESQ
jgi:hypothetical protein